MIPGARGPLGGPVNRGPVNGLVEPVGVGAGRRVEPGAGQLAGMIRPRARNNVGKVAKRGDGSMPMGWLRVLRKACAADEDLWRATALLVGMARIPDLEGSSLTTVAPAIGELRRRTTVVLRGQPDVDRLYCSLGVLVATWLLDSATPSLALADLARATAGVYTHAGRATQASLLASEIGMCLLPLAGHWGLVSAGRTDTKELPAWPTDKGTRRLSPALVAALGACDGSGASFSGPSAPPPRARDLVLACAWDYEHPDSRRVEAWALQALTSLVAEKKAAATGQRPGLEAVAVLDRKKKALTVDGVRTDCSARQAQGPEAL